GKAVPGPQTPPTHHAAAQTTQTDGRAQCGYRTGWPEILQYIASAHEETSGRHFRQYYVVFAQTRLAPPRAMRPDTPRSDASPDSVRALPPAAASRMTLPHDNGHLADGTEPRSARPSAAWSAAL